MLLLNRPVIQPLPVRSHCLESGVRLVHQYLPTTSVAVADVWVKAGAIAEPDAWSGMAHFLEHMVFKGSHQLGVGEFDALIEGKGGIANAATSYDYAHFYVATAAPYLSETLPHLAEILLRPALPADELLREREVVLDEIRGSFDDPDWLGMQSLLQLLYPQHPYGRSILGPPEQLQTYDRSELAQFHRGHYQPENIVVSVVGAIPRDEAMPMVSELFREFPTSTPVPTPILRPELPLKGVQREILHLPRLETGRLLMGWRGSGIQDLPTAVGLDILSVLVASGRTSRLVKTLREERQLVFDIASDFSVQRESSLLTISAWAEPQRLEMLENLILDELEQLRAGVISDAELARCQRLLLNDHTFSTESPGQLAGLYGYYETLSAMELATAYPELVLQQTTASLQALAQRFFELDKYGVVAIVPG
ncbi:MAG: pitrilysin family protein [Cyanobacteria bacterium P01_H01_bin.15]